MEQTPQRLLRRRQNAFIAVFALLALLFLGYLMLRPDVAAGHFQRAQSLQTAGQLDRALRLYNIIVETQPRSAYAPLALQQEGEILTALARQTGDAQKFREAVAAYARLANLYPSHSAAGEALLSAGSLALGDLNDPQTAARFYNTLLERYASNDDYASEATLRLGRIALREGDAARAQQMFARVLQQWARFPDRCAEAQYHIGVTLETLQKNKIAARAAYEATIKKYPRSVWAGDAKERLGLMTYVEGARPARRVLLDIAPLPKTSGDSRETALRLVLAARGLEISDTTWRGWSLAPFWGDFAPGNPGRVLSDKSDWEDVVANAGLVYARRASHDAKKSLDMMRDELDAGHLVLADAGGWLVVTGYDSTRDEIFTRRTGAQSETFAARDFATKWHSDNEYSLLTFHAPGEHLKAQVEKPTPASVNSPAPALVAPRYIYKLPPLSRANAHRRALRRAAALMKRPREGDILLNLEALRALQTELEKLSAAPTSPIPAPETAAKTETDETAPTTARTPLPDATPASTPAPPSAAPRFDPAPRWKNLHKWFGAPLKNWIEARRDAAAFCEDAKKPAAANAWRDSITALENAATTLPADDAFDTDPEAGRAALKNLAAQIGIALRAEERATAAMS